MPSTKEIRSRIISVKSTQQTTKAMKVVSASKLKRAQTAIQNARPYALEMERLVSNLIASQSIKHPLLEKRESGKTLYIILSSDRGLCGGFNANISKFSMQNYKEEDQAGDIIFLGRKAESYFRHRATGNKLELIENMAKQADYKYAKDLTSKILNLYNEQKYAKVVLIYNKFVSALQQDPTMKQLLPIVPEGQVETSDLTDYIFKPAANQIVDNLVDKYLAVQVQRAIFESLASEHGARMNAMENASKNAGELIKTLTLSYNKIRQAAITTELIEITSGAQAIAN